MPALATNLMIGDSPQMRVLRGVLSTVAASNSTVLVTGESGTGKELVARELHLQSPRSGGPFVPINCGAIPKDLIESELFGHRKGAFTGALADRVGRFEMSHGGTLFLDEIGDLPLELQVKLLRVLQERQVEPLGSNRSVPIDVRIVAATHKDLEKAVGDGNFREDLYYRLNVLPIRTSALRDRIADVPELVAHFAEQFRQPANPPVRLGPEMSRLFLEYHWPGNIRELSNLIDRFSAIYPGQILCPSRIPDWLLPSGMVSLKQSLEPTGEISAAEAMADAEAADVHGTLRLVSDHGSRRFVGIPAQQDAADDEPLDAVADHEPEPRLDHNPVQEVILRAQGVEPLHPGGISLRERMIDIERGYIEQALERTQWNVSQTARMLNLQRTTLIEKINKYGLRKA